MSKALEYKLSFLKTLIIVISANILGISGFDYYTEKPDFFKSCRLSSPDFLKCTTDLTQDILNRLAKGELPKVTAKLGSLNPMKVEDVTLEGDESQAVSMSAKLTDLYVKGVSDIVITDVRINKKNFSWLTKAFIPKVHLSGKYEMKGKILLIPINGAGNFYIEVYNMSTVIRTKTHLYEKSDLTFYNVTEVHVNMKVSDMHSQFDNLFNGQSEEIERSTNQFFNDNWREVFEALRPIITDTVDRLLLKILKTTFDIIPATFCIEDIPKSTELYSKNNQ